MTRQVAAAVVRFALTIALATAPAFGQVQPGGHHRIGYLYGPPVTPGHLVFEAALRDLGWETGRNITIEYRSAEGRLDRLPGLAAELVALHVEVIVANSAPETSAAGKATRDIPIVFAAHGDPVGTGDVASLAYPGGNVTGVSQMHPDLSGKLLGLLRELLPGVKRVAVLWDATVGAKEGDWQGLRIAARAWDIVLQSRELRSRADLEAVLASIRTDRPDALLILGDPLLYSLRQAIADFAIRERLPAMYPWQSGAQAGGLISYGADTSDLIRRAAGYVDAILRGAKPAELPVQQPTKFELVVNAKTAKAIGMTIPESVLLRADRVIE